mgnify:CR=1 FL=1
MKIYIETNKTAGTRTCDWSKVSKEELLMSSIKHINDVQKGINFFAKKLLDIAIKHDYTKIDHIDEFYEDFKTGFKTTTWWNMHKEKERHHLKEKQYIPNNINLLDILEMITDGVMAGMVRSGQYKKEEIPDELQKQAFDNTVQMLLENIVVK